MYRLGKKITVEVSTCSIGSYSCYVTYIHMYQPHHRLKNKIAAQTITRYHPCM